MTLTITSPDRLSSRVAVADDDENALSRGCDQVRFLKHEPYRLLIRERRPLQDVLDEVRSEGCGALISDHRFKTRANVNFDGAELVYRANQDGLPAVLYSAHVDEDEADSIRAWRYGIPRVVRKERGSTRALAEALIVAEKEVHGERELARQGFLTPVRVVSVPDKSTAGSTQRYPMADVTVTAWRPRALVPMPMSLLPEEALSTPETLPGRIFLGEVNYYAEHGNELFFHNLRDAPPSRLSRRTDRNIA